MRSRVMPIGVTAPMPVITTRRRSATLHLARHTMPDADSFAIRSAARASPARVRDAIPCTNTGPMTPSRRDVTNQRPRGPVPDVHDAHERAALHGRKSTRLPFPPSLRECGENESCREPCPTRRGDPHQRCPPRRPVDGPNGRFADISTSAAAVATPFEKADEAIVAQSGPATVRRRPRAQNIGRAARGRRARRPSSSADRSAWGRGRADSLMSPRRRRRPARREPKPQPAVHTGERRSRFTMATRARRP